MTRNLDCSFKWILLLGMLTLSQIIFGQTNAVFIGSLLTQVSKSTSGTDTTRLLICRSKSGNKLSVYTVAQGVVSSATAYKLSGTGNNFILHIRSIDQQHEDSMHFMFDDAALMITVDRTDRYILFRDAYKNLKAMIQKRQLTALLNLLNDNMGDYPIKDVLTFIRMHPQVSKQIRLAYITTRRSQSELTDHWVGTFAYDRFNHLKQLKVSSGNVIRYTRLVNSVSQNAVAVSTYLNIEDRQITEQKITYSPAILPSFKWQESVYEPAKDRTTEALISVSAKDLGSLPGAELSINEVLRILKIK
jgi:hypothetical protein